MLKPLVLLISIALGAIFGWHAGKPGGLMGAYLLSVFGASFGLFIGRKIQNSMDGD